MDDRYQKLQEQADKALRVDRKRARSFEDMLRSEGWKLYVELLNTHITLRTQDAFAPTPPGGEYAEQHNKGAVYGLLWARDLPSVTIAAVKDSAPATEENSDDY